jgi:hypothetical protein
MKAPNEQLLLSMSAARTARIVVAAGHVAEILGPGSAGTGVAGQEIVYVDDEGAPLLLLPCAAARPVGLLSLRFRAWPMLGDVVIVGRALEPITAERRRRILTGLLDSHGRCLERQKTPCPARLVGMSVERVTIVAHETGELTPVDAGSYHQAEPCLFETFGPPLMEHLADSHLSHLLGLVRSTGIADDPLAVEPLRLEAAALTVRVIDADGGREERITFPQPLLHPHCLGGTLQQMLTKGHPE